jgi:hypothetical protein
MKRWILLMKYCEVKTKKQIFLVFLKAHLSIGTLLTPPVLALFFHILFVLHSPGTGKSFQYHCKFLSVFHDLMEIRITRIHTCRLAQSRPHHLRTPLSRGRAESGKIPEHPSSVSRLLAPTNARQGPNTAFERQPVHENLPVHNTREGSFRDRRTSADVSIHPDSFQASESIVQYCW